MAKAHVEHLTGHKFLQLPECIVLSLGSSVCLPICRVSAGGLARRRLCSEDRDGGTAATGSAFRGGAAARCALLCVLELSANFEAVVPQRAPYVLVLLEELVDSLQYTLLVQSVQRLAGFAEALDALHSSLADLDIADVILQELGDHGNAPYLAELLLVVLLSLDQRAECSKAVFSYARDPGVLVGGVDDQLHRTSLSNARLENVRLREHGLRSKQSGFGQRLIVRKLLEWREDLVHQIGGHNQERVNLFLHLVVPSLVLYHELVAIARCDASPSVALLAALLFRVPDRAGPDTDLPVFVALVFEHLNDIVHLEDGNLL